MLNVADTNENSIPSVVFQRLTTSMAGFALGDFTALPEQLRLACKVRS